MADDAVAIDGVAGICRMSQISSNSRPNVPTGFCQVMSDSGGGFYGYGC
jgi:hypothetical protein